MDLCGPIRVQSINGKKYILVIVDDYSRFTWVKFLRSKDETPAFVINLLKQLQVGLNKTVRRNRTLVEAARTMLIFSKAPLFLWAEAVATACYTKNRSLIHTLHDKTPYELVHDKKQDLLFLRIFGALCYPTNDSEDLGKLKAKADIGFFVGYAPNRKGYRIYNKRTRQIMETIHVTFDELTGQTAPVHSSSGPAPNLLTPGPISSGLTSTVDRLVPPAPAAQALVNPNSPSVSIPIDQEAPSRSHSSSSSDDQSSSVHQGVAAEQSCECILKGPYTPTIVTTPDVPTTEDSPAVPEQTTVKTVTNMTLEHRAHFKSEKEVIYLILTGIGDEIYSTIDACQIAQEMWEAIERLQQGLVKDKAKVITDLKLKEEKDIDKMISMENQLKFLNEIVYKRSQSIQTIHILVPYREETLTLKEESRSKLNKDLVKPFDYTKLNSLYENFKPPTQHYEIQFAQANEIRKKMWRKSFVKTKPNIFKNIDFLPVSKSISKSRQAYNVMTNNINHLKEIVNQAWVKHSNDLLHLRNPTAQDMEILVKTCLMPLALKTQNDSFAFVHELKQEMHADLKYVESLEDEIDELESDKAEFSNMYDMLLQECVSKDVMCSYLQSSSDLDEITELQCLYLHKVRECDCLAQKLSEQTEFVSKEIYTELLRSFAKLEKHSISLEIALQQCQEQLKNDTVCKEKASNVFRKMK
ncbi:retrovirus-related pol polyprotein from transposon TNT 1-94 [Tanacetum coccineum]